MIVVSNTSPLNYLVLIDSIDVLPALYGAVLVPPAVLEELADPASPERVRSWASAPPQWLRIERPRMSDAPSSIGVLHEGETHAITLALQQKADRLLIDERAGTGVARSLGLRAIGNLGILDLAAEQRLINLPSKLGQLESETNFRMTRSLRVHILQRDALRQKPQP
jgi:predicted nucleic acid-binding protein